MTETQQRPLRYLPAILLALVPPAYICIAIYLYSVDIPQWDEWGLVPFHERFANGTLSLTDLFAQYNEFRQFFPNLVFVVVGYLSKGDLRFVMYVTFVVACFISYNVYRLSEATLPISPAQRWWLLAAANVLLFSPVPVENWLQGQQLIYFVPAAALITCLRVAYSNNSRPQLKLLCCALLCIVSTFSSANGFVCWVLIVPALLRAPAWLTLQHKLVWLCGWLTGFALSIGIYLNGYHKPPMSPALTHVLAYPFEDFLYWLSLLGGPFGFGRIVLSVATGALLVGLFLWATGIYLKHWRSNSRMLCWLIVGAYSIITAALITIGRAGLGILQSLSTRYVTFTIFLAVALVYLLTTMRWESLRPRIAVVVTLVIVVHVPIYVFGIRNMRGEKTQALREKACIHFINVIADDCQVRVSPGIAQLRTFANSLNRLGYLRPPLATSGVLPAATDALEPEIYGSFIELKASGTSEYTASGLAELPHRKGPPDAVLLACENSNREPEIFAIADVKRARWYKTFNIQALPSDTCTMTAWAFDADSGKAFKISGAHTAAKD